MRVAPLLVIPDLRFVFHRQPDVVEPFEQHGLAEIVYFETLADLRAAPAGSLAGKIAFVDPLAM